MNEFVDPTEVGDTLAIKVFFEGRNIPVVISRKAMEDHFEAARGGSDHLVKAYVRNSAAIDARVLTRAIPGTAYTKSNPLVINAGDL
jgi:hypothetical protein